MPHAPLQYRARWPAALLEHDPGHPLTLERQVDVAAGRMSLSRFTITTEAPYWGGGAVLWENSSPPEWAAWRRHEDSAPHLAARRGLPDFQSFWEFLTLGLALTAWDTLLRAHELRILGDNTSSLHDLLDMKRGGIMASNAGEIAWRRAHYDW